MAIVSSIAVGKARNSAGNVTFATVKGRVIMREKVTNIKNPNTLAQQKQRASMSEVVKFYQRVGRYSKATLTSSNQYASPYNNCVSKNIAVCDYEKYTHAGDNYPTYYATELGGGGASAASYAATGSVNHFNVDLDCASVTPELYVVGNKAVLLINSTKTGKTYTKEQVLTQNDIDNEELSVSIVHNENSNFDVFNAYFGIVKHNYSDGTRMTHKRAGHIRPSH